MARRVLKDAYLESILTIVGRAKHGTIVGQVWDVWSRPYNERIIKATKAKHPDVPITLYVNGSGGLLERMASTSADVIGLDWTIDMADCRRRIGPDVSIQVSTSCSCLLVCTWL